MVAKPGVVKGQAHTYFPTYLAQRSRIGRIDKWCRGEQQSIRQVAGEYLDGKPFSPRSTTAEYDDLASRAPGGWAGLVVTSLAQTAYVDGVRAPSLAGEDGDGELLTWQTWQRNGWDARQIALHRDTIAHGLAFGVALPGVDPITGRRMTQARGVSAIDMAAFYDDDGEDEWPTMALRAYPQKRNLNGDYDWMVRVLDEDAVHYLSVKDDWSDLGNWTYISYEEHGLGVPPVVRYANRLDLRGRATGEIEPYIPLFRRIDQDVFDRLIVQRFGAWKVRYIAGMAAPDGGPEAEKAAALKLSVQDFLASGDPNTKFGTLDATDLRGFIEAGDADLRHLSAVTQTPPHHLLGLSANLQAEALAAAEAGLMRKSGDFRTLVGESHEQFLRLMAHAEGNLAEAQAFDMQVRWRDTESRSFMQTIQALGQMATTLKVPVQMLWEQVPGWTDADVKRALSLVESGAMDALLDALVKGGQIEDEPAAEETGGDGNQE